MRLTYFIKKLVHPKTGIYILLGIIIMFLTFLTTNNALEIAVSGIASIFIGIGVNNFTQEDTREKDKEKDLLTIGEAIKILEHTRNKVSNTQTLLKENISLPAAANQLNEIQEFIEIGLSHLKENQK